MKSPGGSWMMMKQAIDTNTSVGIIASRSRTTNAIMRAPRATERPLRLLEEELDRVEVARRHDDPVLGVVFRNVAEVVLHDQRHRHQADRTDRRALLHGHLDEALPDGDLPRAVDRRLELVEHGLHL